MIRRVSLAFLLLAGGALRGPASLEAAVNVVATTSSLAMLVRTVGGDAVKIAVLSPPDRDAHYLMARPSMMVALRRADLLLAVGADLEVAWLPEALRGASNPKILPGQSGYFEGAAQIELIEVGQAADRARGDVHPAGNPHYYMDPERMARVGKALAERLAALQPSEAARFAANAEAFARAVAERVPSWKEQARGAPGLLPYHKDVNYLASLLGVPVLGYVEPLPGIPPTAAHLRDLVDRLKGQRGVILYNTYHSGDGPAFLAKNLGWGAQQLQLEVDLDADGLAYLDHIGKWVTAIARGKP
jgi:zinc/manganese transport system substrate-binding protein